MSRPRLVVLVATALVAGAVARADDAPRWLLGHAVHLPSEYTNQESGYFSIVEGKNSKLYIGTAKYGVNCYLLEFDPAREAVRMVVDVHRVLMRWLRGFAAQAKIHTRNNVGRVTGKIYFGSKQGYPEKGEKAEYPGGYVFAYDPKTDQTENLGMPKAGHGVISVMPDEARGLVYVSTCNDVRPVESSHFMILDLKTRAFRDLGDCQHSFAFIVLDHKGRAYHPLRGGRVARYDPEGGRLDKLDVTVDGKPCPPELRKDGAVINWETSPDGKTLYAVEMTTNQLFAFDLTSPGAAVPGRRLGALLPQAKATDCRALCVGPDGTAWMALTEQLRPGGPLTHLVSYAPGAAAPRDHGPVGVANPDYLALTDASGKTKPWHHTLRREKDGTLTPWQPLGICATADGSVYVTTLAPFTLLRFTRAQLRAEALPASRYRRAHEAVRPVSETTVIAEAEEFAPAGPGWEARPWGTNYYAATFANSFLSRKAYLAAPEQAEKVSATITVEVPRAGRYLALVRYEACYRFETQFRLQIEQLGKTRLDRLYGARDNLRIWAFGQKLKKEVAWDWGAGENVVWEGHDAGVELVAGPARLTLVASRQPEPAARRHVDLVMLTSDEAQVKQRIEKENYLPLDGMLTQAGDVFFKLHNRGPQPLTLTVPNGTEHSPYWVHQRDWKPRAITAEPGKSSEWVEVGSLLDTLNDGQWPLTTASKGAVRFDLEVGVRDAAGQTEAARSFRGLTGNLTLAYDADTRYSRRIRQADDVLYDLVNFLKERPVAGRTPARTLVYGITFDPRPEDSRYTAALAEFTRLIGATALNPGKGDEPGLRRGYIDVRDVPTKDLEAYCRKLPAERIAVVSLGDEIDLASPPTDDHAGFRRWLRERGVKPADLDLAAGGDYERLRYRPDAAAAKEQPALYYYAQLYRYRFGTRQLKERTDILRRLLPHAGIGANFSPHHGSMYLGPTHHWISVFREGGMTMPWGEDYIFQVPVGSQQMNFLMVDMFRAGIRNQPGAKIHYYVMPHAPNNTPRSWRRQFYGDLAHGVQIFNLFEFRPVQAAYTENHVSDLAMYQEVRTALHELGLFEDVVQDGRPAPGLAGIWFSEAGDVWENGRAPFDAAKRALAVAIRHRQLPLDVVVDGDKLEPYRVLYLTDANVSRAGSEAIAAWVRDGGRLFATAGAGMFDEFNRPNTVLRELLGVEPETLQPAPGPTIRFEKQDLPFAEPMDEVTWGKAKLPVFGVRARVKLRGATAAGTFRDGTPAVSTKATGRGAAMYCGFLPSLTYFQPALPRRPFDRGATDDSYTHFLPEDFHRGAGDLIGAPAGELERPVVCSAPFVEAGLLRSKDGVVIPLINWSRTPARGLRVTVTADLPVGTVRLASGRPVQARQEANRREFTLDLDVADALILR